MEQITYKFISLPDGGEEYPIMDPLERMFEYEEFQVQDINQLLNLSLLREEVPIELRAIVNAYYGDSSGELEGHLMIAKRIVGVIKSQETRMFQRWEYINKLPCIDIEPEDFTKCIAYHYNMFVVNQANNKSLTFVPQLFYKYYKLLDNPVFIPPRKFYPSLYPPMPDIPAHIKKSVSK